MALSDEITAAAGEIKQLTDADTSGDIRFQNKGSNTFAVMGTTDATAPSKADFARGWIFHPGMGYEGTLASLWPHASFVRLWVLGADGAVVGVSFA